MRVNVNHPSFISFLDMVTCTILSNISVNTYFGLPNNKKINVQYMVLKLMKNAFKSKAKLSDDELKSFVVVLWRKNEDIENYEFAAILNDIKNNFETINDSIKPKKNTKTIKIETNE